MDTGIRSQVDQNKPQCRMVGGNRNTKSEFLSIEAWKDPEWKEEDERESEKQECEQKELPKFKLHESQIHNGKGKPISNSSESIHSVYASTITTQEGSNAVREWSEKRQDSRESSAR